MADDNLIIGIDLGTTNSVVAIWDLEKKEPLPITNQAGSALIPSVVTFDPETEKPIVGRAAVDQMLDRPEDVIHSVKRFIGLSFEDPQVQLSREQVTFRIEAIEGGPRRRVVIRAAGQVLPPVQVSKYVLEELKGVAEDHLKQEVKQAVITVPAYFTESQRHATMDAAVRAGLDVKRLINEPTAAALAFKLEERPQNVVVYDLGGGTFDVSIIEINKKGMYRVIATSGDNHLGGDDFDEKLANWIKEQFQVEHAVPLLASPHQEVLLREKAEEAKIALSESAEYLIELEGLRAVDDQDYHFAKTVTRETFESLIQTFIDRTLEICDKTLQMAWDKTNGKLLAASINQVLLVGGQTLTPAVGEALHTRYGWKLNRQVRPDLVVGMGAAVQAGLLSGDSYLKKCIKLWDVVAQPLGIEAQGEEMPEGQTMFVMIEANQQIPTRTKNKRARFTNDATGQTKIEFRVYQGADHIAANNTHLGDVILPLTRTYEKGEALVECWFRIDWDGILHVHAKEMHTDAKEVVEKIDYFYYLGQREEEEIE
jgi:molecular chaperone DnaK